MKKVERVEDEMLSARKKIILAMIEEDAELKRWLKAELKCCP